MLWWGRSLRFRSLFCRRRALPDWRLLTIRSGLASGSLVKGSPVKYAQNDPVDTIIQCPVGGNAEIAPLPFAVLHFELLGLHIADHIEIIFSKMEVSILSFNRGIGRPTSLGTSPNIVVACDVKRRTLRSSPTITIAMFTLLSRLVRSLFNWGQQLVALLFHLFIDGVELFVG